MRFRYLLLPSLPPSKIHLFAQIKRYHAAEILILLNITAAKLMSQPAVAMMVETTNPSPENIF